MDSRRRYRLLVLGLQGVAQRTHTQEDVMKEFIAGIFVGFMILAVFYFLFDSMSLEEERREAAASQCDQEIARCTTGQHCKVMGRDLLTITARGAR